MEIKIDGANLIFEGKTVKDLLKFLKKEEAPLLVIRIENGNKTVLLLDDLINEGDEIIIKPILAGG